MFSEAIIQAEAMISAFAHAGCDQFDVTLKTLAGEKKQFRRNVSSKKLQRDLSSLMEVAEHDSLSIIVRPYSKTAAYIQLDDIREEVALRLIPYSCCVLETSTGNFQAFIAVAGLDRPAKEMVRNGLIDSASADKGASGAARLAGSFNFKQLRRRDDGSYPQVRLVSSGGGRVFSVPELVAAGLIKARLLAVPQQVTPKPKKPPRRRIYPSYERARHSVRRKEDGTIDRSAVDLLFAVTCLDWQITMEQTIKLLHEQSPKAGERYDDYAERTVAKAQALIEERVGRTSRRKRRRKPAQTQF